MVPGRTTIVSEEFDRLFKKTASIEAVVNR